MSKMKKIIVLAVAVSLVLGMTFVPTKKVSADDHFLHDETIILANGSTYTIHALDEGYNRNVYVSLKDMATILSGTESAFSIDYTDGKFVIVMGENGNPDRMISGWTEDEKAIYKGKSLSFNDMTIDDNPRKYYTIRATYRDDTDCFMSMINLAMILDTNMYVSGTNTITIENGKRLVISPESLAADGFFQDVNSVLVGDATTGQVFYEYDGDVVYPIASTTKLMTTLLVTEAMAEGTIAADTMVTLSEEAARISESADGNIPMKAGNQAPVSELLIGALLPSSNECALALAEALGGTEQNFAQMMNSKAAELSMSSATFYNSNGLPEYNSSGMPSKRQNTMNAEDMFRLCSFILNSHPEIKGITSMQIANLPHLGKDVANTNSLLFNMPEVTGLKTGTTVKAGACLVTSLVVNDGSMDHDLVVVVFGAEGSKARFTTSELMARYAKKVVTGELSAKGTPLTGGATATDEGGEEQPRAITSEALINKIVSGAFKLGQEQ